MSFDELALLHHIRSIIRVNISNEVTTGTRPNLRLGDPEIFAEQSNITFWGVFFGDKNLVCESFRTWYVWYIKTNIFVCRFREFRLTSFFTNSAASSCTSVSRASPNEVDVQRLNRWDTWRRSKHKNETMRYTQCNTLHLSNIKREDALLLSFGIPNGKMGYAQCNTRTLGL